MKVSFYNEEGHRLSGNLYLAEAKSPALILCPGFAGLKEMFLPDIAKYLNKSGYSALALDYRGFGESEGLRWSLFPLGQVNDIVSAVSFLETLETVDAEKIGVVGFSYGGGNAVYAAAIDSRIKCMISVMGVGNGEKWLHYLRKDESDWQNFLKRLEETRASYSLTGKLERVDPLEIYTPDPETKKGWVNSQKNFPERAEMKMTLLSGDAIIRFKPEEIVHAVSPRPSLFISAENDIVVPISQQESMFRNAGEPKLHKIIQGASHQDLYRPPYLELMMNVCTDWLKEHL